MQRVRDVLRHIQIEDVTLAAILLLTPFVAPITNLLPVFGGGNDFLGGLVAFLAAVGAIVAMATRVPDQNRLEKPVPETDALPMRIWLVGPFIGAVGFVAGDSLDRMGLPGGDVLVGIAVLVAMVAFLAGKRLPVVSRNTRRLLVGPFVLLCTAFLQQLAAQFTGAFAGTDVLGQLLAMHNPIFVIELFGILGFIALIFYEMFVFAPRELADPGASSRAWAVRFAIFYVSLAAAILVGGSGLLLVA
ncbi:MAG: hypothetical protein ABI744_07325 [Chloroflexota bacterium]